jgi:hypothetical protein
MIRRTLLALMLTAGLVLAADPALLKFLPADAKLVLGVDVEKAKVSPFGQRLLAEVKADDKEFQQLVTMTGFDPRRDLAEVVMASSAEMKEKSAVRDMSIVVARGAFDAGKIAQFASQNGIQPQNYAGTDIYQPPSKQGQGAVAFLANRIAVIGSLEQVKAALDRNQSGSGALTGALLTRVKSLSGQYDAWLVSTIPVGGVAPKSGNGGLKLPLDAILEASGGVTLGAMVNVDAQAGMRSEKDATALADVIRFLASMVQLNSDKPGAAEAARLLDSMKVDAVGTTVTFKLSIPQTEIDRFFDEHAKPKAKRPERAAVKHSTH